MCYENKGPKIHKNASKHFTRCALVAFEEERALSISSFRFNRIRCTTTMTNALYLVHRAGLMVQACGMFKKYLSLPVHNLGGGNRKIPEKGVLVATVQTAARLVESSFQFKRFLSSCDILIIDEIHVNKRRQLKSIASRCSARMRFGLSGTIDESNLEKMLLYESLVGPVIARIKNRELVALGRSARPIIRLVEPKADEVFGNYMQSYREAIVTNVARNRLVLREAFRYMAKGLRVLITVGRVKHGRILLAAFRKKMEAPVEFIFGGTPLYVRKCVKKDFIKGRLPVLIASPIFDVGEDIAGGVDSWINAAAGLSWELTIQRMGRVLRKKATGKNVVFITDFLDLHNDYLARHSLARFRWFLDEKICKIKVIRRRDDV